MRGAAGQRLVLLAALIAGCLPAFAPGEVAADPDQADEGSWIERTLNRYFGGRQQQGDERAGATDQLVDPYLEHIGKPIEVVLIHAVNRFEDDWRRTGESGSRILAGLTQTLQSYTRDDLIRQYLLFGRGDRVDPFLLGDSERMLRDLEFINDVRIILVPLDGGIESVAVVVEYRDRWPFGASGRIKDVSWYNAGLFHTNLLGRGIRADAEILYRQGYENELGFGLSLRRANLRATFADVAVAYEDSWRELAVLGEIRRDLVHPGIKWLGGAGFVDRDDRDNEGVPRHFRQGDVWAGRTIRLAGRTADVTSARTVLVPAARFFNRGWHDRPAVRADTNTAYHGLRSYQVGLTFQRIRNYRTSYLFRMGELENVPAGQVHKITAGYDDGEFFNRTFAVLQNSYSRVGRRGGVVTASLDFGGFIRNGRFEDGLLGVSGFTISPLLGAGSYRTRLMARLEYVRGIDRLQERGLVLGNRTGLREMEDDRVFGDQRLLLQTESRVFTPWRLWGFHFMIFGFADVGKVAGEDEDLLAGKYYTSLGLGLRLNNPDLVIRTLQLRVAVLNSVEGDQWLVTFKAGNPDYPLLQVPGVKPGFPAFE